MNLQKKYRLQEGVSPIVYIPTESFDYSVHTFTRVTPTRLPSIIYQGWEYTGTIVQQTTTKPKGSGWTSNNDQPSEYWTRELYVYVQEAPIGCFEE